MPYFSKKAALPDETCVLKLSRMCFFLGDGEVFLGGMTVGFRLRYSMEGQGSQKTGTGGRLGVGGSAGNSGLSTQSFRG